MCLLICLLVHTNTYRMGSSLRYRRYILQAGRLEQGKRKIDGGKK